MLPCYYKVVRVNTVGKVASVQQATFQEDERGLLHVLGKVGRLSYVRDDERKTFNWGSKLLQVARSTPHRSIGLDAKKGVELRASNWDTWSDWVKVEKGNERREEKQIRASPEKHGSSGGVRCQAQETSHEEKAKAMREEAVTPQDVWFELSSVTMNKTSNLTSSDHTCLGALSREWRRSDGETSTASKDQDARREKAGCGWGSCRRRRCQRPNAMNLVNRWYRVR